MNTDKDSLVALLEKAHQQFLELYYQNLEYSRTLQPQHEEYINTAHKATLMLMALGTKKLKELEEQRLIHTSTIAGGSLESAVFALKIYNLGQRTFDKDYIEQLARSCDSAAEVIKQEII